jgi:hypothetical protein
MNVDDLASRIEAAHGAAIGDDWESGGRSQGPVHGTDVGGGGR